MVDLAVQEHSKLSLDTHMELLVDCEHRMRAGVAA